MSFYEFLWEAVRRPSLIIEYAKELGIRLPEPPEDFYRRLEYVARAVAMILEIERGDDYHWHVRYGDAKRFCAEAQQDLKDVGIDLDINC